MFREEIHMRLNYCFGAYIAGQRGDIQARMLRQTGYIRGLGQVDWRKFDQLSGRST